MLHEFLEANRLELTARCRATGSGRSVLSPTSTEYGVPVLIDQLIEMLRTEHLNQTSEMALQSPLGRARTRNGSDLLRRYLIVEQVVRDYHDLADALIELALEKNERFSVAEFQTLDRCLDGAIASAISASERQ